MKYIKRLGSLSGEEMPATNAYQHLEEPLYASGAGRQALDGSYVGTLIGWFPKLVFKFPPMGIEKAKQLRQALRDPEITVEWYDQTYDVYRISQFTVDSFGSGIHLSNKIIDEMQVTLTSIKRVIK